MEFFAQYLSYIETKDLKFSNQFLIYKYSLAFCTESKIAIWPYLLRNDTFIHDANGEGIFLLSFIRTKRHYCFSFICEIDEDLNSSSLPIICVL